MVSKGDEDWVSARPQHVLLKLIFTESGAGLSQQDGIGDAAVGVPGTVLEGVVTYLEALGSVVGGEVRTASCLKFSIHNRIRFPSTERKEGAPFIPKMSCMAP